MKSLSFKVGIILLSIELFVFIGYLEPFGGKRIYFCGNPPIYCYFDQQSIVYASKNIVSGWIKSVHKEEFNIDIGAKLRHRRWFSKSEDIPIILFVFIAVWGSAIIFVLGAILYRIVIEPGIKKRKLTREEDRQKQLSQKPVRPRRKCKAKQNLGLQYSLLLSNLPS